jgi:hypothetical protein
MRDQPPRAPCDCGHAVPILAEERRGDRQRFRVLCGARDCAASTAWRKSEAAAAAAWNLGRPVPVRAGRAPTQIRLGGRWVPVVELPRGVLAVGVAGVHRLYVCTGIAFAVHPAALRGFKNLTHLFRCATPLYLSRAFFGRGERRGDWAGEIRERVLAAAVENIEISGELQSRIIDSAWLGFGPQRLRQFEFTPVPRSALIALPGSKRR